MRPLKLTGEQVQCMIARYEAGESLADLARAFGCAARTVRAALQRADIRLRPVTFSPAERERRRLLGQARWASGEHRPSTRGLKHSPEALAKMRAHWRALAVELRTELPLPAEQATKSDMTPDEIRAFRVGHYLSQRDLARYLGISQGAVWRWESGRGRSPPYLRLALAELARLIEMERL